MYKANLSHKLLKGYLEDLLSRELIIEVAADKGRKYIQLTERGLDFLHQFEKLRELGYDLPEEFASFPSIILDDVSSFWAVRGGNDLLAPYTLSFC